MSYSSVHLPTSFPGQVWKFPQARQRRSFGGFCSFAASHSSGCAQHVSHWLATYKAHTVKDDTSLCKANDLLYNFLQPCLSCRASDYGSPMFCLWWFMLSAFVLHPSRFVLPAVVGPGKGAAFLLLLMSPVHKDPKCMLVCLQVIIRRNKNY